MPWDQDQRYRGEGVLVLADGRVFRGKAFGAETTAVGEVVFNTAMSGYQEIITDPSYAGQFVCLTAPEIGNVGVNDDDRESQEHGAAALLVRSLSPVASNWRSQQDLSGSLEARGIPGLAEFDTRALTRHLREHGAQMGAVSTEHTRIDELLELARKAESMEGKDLASEVTTREAYEWTQPTWNAEARGVEAPDCDLHVVAYDFGIKLNILRMLRDEGVRTTVVPAGTPAAAVLAMKPDGVFLSNGPGDPAALVEVIPQLKELLEAQSEQGFPVFGICLGHQLLCLALGGTTYKLKFGHHGGNHPVREDAGGRVSITSQNHGFAVDAESLASHRAEVSEINLFDGTVAGLLLAGRDVRGVQYHPEASPGPHDAKGHFASFAASMRQHKVGASG
jgi:carbamoyl-phosphate synthase small subunit